MAKMQRGCELCDGIAALHCAADEAHICWTCDAKVHSANFLVARHTRSVLCGTCGIPTPWRASGANPTPLTGLCANCSQVESQGECTTHDDGMVLDTLRAASRLCPTLVVGRTVSGDESGCSTSNADAERCDGKVVEGDTVRASPCESASQLSSEDVEGMSVDRSSVQASVFSGISKLLQRKRQDYCSPGAAPWSKQIMTKALVDVNRSVAHRQCECASTTSWSSNNRIVTHAHQDTTFEVRDCNRSQSQAMDCSKRGIVTLLLSSAKRQRMNGTAQRRPSLPRSQQPGALSTSRLMSVLAKWHWDLHLSSPGTIPLALRMFCKVSRALAPAALSNLGMRVTLAACLRLAAGLDEAQIFVPTASGVAAYAGVSTRRLAMTEIHLLALLGWRRSPMWGRCLHLKRHNDIWN